MKHCRIQVDQDRDRDYLKAVQENCSGNDLVMCVLGRATSSTYGLIKKFLCCDNPS